jgi:hypothetical protein
MAVSGFKIQLTLRLVRTGRSEGFIVSKISVRGLLMKIWLFSGGVDLATNQENGTDDDACFIQDTPVAKMPSTFDIDPACQSGLRHGWFQ